MAGIEFRVGHNQHRVVDDFLSDGPPGVGGIVVEGDKLRHQSAVATTARQHGLAVIVETGTERLVGPGFSGAKRLPYAGKAPLDPAHDLAGHSAKEEFVAEVLDLQWELATEVTAPHFHVRGEEDLDMNLALARAAVHAADGEVPVRATLSASLRDFLAKPGAAELAAWRYGQAGVSTVELRPSPLGGRKEARRKIRDLLRVLHDFEKSGPTVVLGFQGVFGPAALSLGLVEKFSVGVGYRESYDHSRVMSSQKKGDSSGGGANPGVFFPEASETVTRRIAKALYEEQQLRTRLRCPIGECAHRVDGPAVNPAEHYLHSRAKSVTDILEQPPQWRPTLLQDRLVKARDFRERINTHLPSDATPLDNTTLKNLQVEVAGALEQAA